MNQFNTTATTKLFIHATNVHQGGGFSLLNALLKALPKNQTVVLSVDERMLLPENISPNIQIKRVKPSVVQRFLAEKWLANHVSAGDTVLCFGNLPPLFKLRGRCMVFIQNRYLIEDIKLTGFSLKVRLRLTIERLWLKKKMANLNEFVVQTPTMKRLLDIKTQVSIPVRILPFAAQPNYFFSDETESDENYCDFIYIASGEPHKNHQRLLEAWCLLAQENIFPSLWLTLDEANFPELFGKIAEIQQGYGVKIINKTGLSHQAVLGLYKKAGALIYPSLLESFGLPLIEARQAGLPILAAELDYVRDVLNPEQTFDPTSALSIARAVKRFMNLTEQPLPLLNAKEFLTQITEWTT